MSTYQLDREQRKREMDFLAFEIGEIEDARLTEGEDETLETEYRRLINGKKITEALNEIYEQTGYERDGSADRIGRAVRRLAQVTEFDENLSGLYASLNDVDAL